MNRENTAYILGGGAIGFPLAAYLGKAGRRAMVVRTSRNDVDLNSQPIEIRDGENLLDASVETVSLARLDAIDGIIVVTAKAHANAAIAWSLKEKGARGPIVVLQNGIGVETPFIEAGFPEVYRCVLYFTAQSPSDHVFSVKPVSASPIGVIHGTGHRLAECVDVLNTGQFPFRAELQIQRDIWKKAIANAAFNSICPLLEIDNGIFARDAKVAALAREVVRECLLLTRRLDLPLGEDELIEQIRRISQASDGQFISTLQDIRAGRRTEIEFLNLAIAQVAAQQTPPIALPRVEMLGRMVLAKAALD